MKDSCVKIYGARLAVFAAAACFMLSGLQEASAAKGEQIIYAVSPVGTSQYEDKGEVMVDGKIMHLVTFQTRAVGFNDLEKIYCDPATFWPVKVERFISYVFSREYIVEEYSFEKHSLTVTKYIGGKKVKEYLFTAGGPIHNAILLPFSLRALPALKPGWSQVVRFPLEFKIMLVNIETVTVPAGAFKAYHFTSEPKKFEIWISADADRVPLKIKGFGGTGYALQMKKRQTVAPGK